MPESNRPAMTCEVPVMLRPNESVSGSPTSFASATVF
jgi:hypothetical protein